MAKTMKLCAAVSIGLTLLCVVLYGFTHTGFFRVLAISFGTAAYHFAMRLAVGTGIHLLLRNHVNYRARWFQVSEGEKKLYKKLNVQKWKAKMPTYDPESFDPKRHSWDALAQAMCQAELVHEAIILLSFVPVFAAIPFGAFWVFMITSLLSACIDAAFVIMQRYNRPRLLRLLSRSPEAIHSEKDCKK